LRIIDSGITAMSNADARVRKYRNYYDKLSPDQKILVKEYLVWMFLTSMYMRFWKGPGNSYPAVWREGGGGNDRCELGQRDKNTQNQFINRTRILEKMPEELQQWVLSFPRIEYNFKENTSSVGAETINFIVEEALKGNFCLAEGSDHLVQTSYYLLKHILNTDLAGFNRSVMEFLPPGTDQSSFNPNSVTVTRHVDPRHRLVRL
jgi:hypothetical protein